jgi:hypothetical protein
VFLTRVWLCPIIFISVGAIIISPGSWKMLLLNCKVLHSQHVRNSEKVKKLSLM